MATSRTPKPLPPETQALVDAIKGPLDLEPAVTEEVAAQLELPAPTHVVGAIARVMAEIGGIRKMTARERAARGLGGDQGVTYAYRGIDQVASAAQPLFGLYGVVIIPIVREVEVEKIVKGNATMDNTLWTRTTVTIDWMLYGPGGIDDRLRSTTVGVADDNSDKGMNKAMTAGFKNLLLRILCIGDPQDDTDTFANTPDGVPHTDEPIDPRPEKHPADVLFERVRDAEPWLKVAVKVWAQDEKGSLTGRALRDEAWRARVEEKIQALIVEHDQDASVEPPAETPTMAAAMDKTLPHHEGGDDTPPSGELVCLSCGRIDFPDLMALEDHQAECGKAVK